jgi:hypothetical protein
MLVIASMLAVIMYRVDTYISCLLLPCLQQLKVLYSKEHSQPVGTRYRRPLLLITVGQLCKHGSLPRDPTNSWQLLCPQLKPVSAHTAPLQGHCMGGDICVVFGAGSDRRSLRFGAQV